MLKHICPSNIVYSALASTENILKKMKICGKSEEVSASGEDSGIRDLEAGDHYFTVRKYQ